MSFELVFLARNSEAKREDVISEYKKPPNKRTWSTNAGFESFVTDLRTTLAALDCEYFLKDRDTNLGIQHVELQGEKFADAHHEIGGLLMLHSIICYDPQSNEVTIELEPI